MTEFPDLDPMHLPRFREWKQQFADDTGLNLQDFLYNAGTLDLAVALCALMWPRVTVVDGCYLRADSNSDFPHHPNMTLAEQQGFEAVSNHLHAYDLFGDTHPDTPLEAYEYVANIILRSWQAALHAQYPDVHFEFDFQTEPDAYGPTITFWHTEAP